MLLPDYQKHATNPKSRARSRRYGYSIVLCVVIFLTFSSRSQSKMAPAFVIYETQIDLSNTQGENVTSCAAIYPDGRYHLMRRVQKLDTFLVTESVYEDLLNSASLSLLERLTDSPDVRNLPDYNKPVVPPASHFSHSFVLRINGPSASRKVGFTIWRGRSATYSIEGAPADIRDAQLASERALGPIVEWFHSLRGHHLAHGESAKMVCE